MLLLARQAIHRSATAPLAGRSVAGLLARPLSTGPAPPRDAAPAPVPAPMHRRPLDPASSMRLQSCKPRIVLPKVVPAAISRPAPAAAVPAPKPAAPAEQPPLESLHDDPLELHAVDHFTPPVDALTALVVKDLNRALAASDPNAAWASYLVLTNSRSMTARVRAGTPTVPARMDHVPPHAHSLVLHLVKSLTNRQFAERHRVRLPLYVVITRVEHVVECMQTAGVPLSHHDIHALVDLYARAGQVRSMEHWFRCYVDLPAADGAAPAVPVKLVNSMLSGYVRTHRMREALRWYDIAVAKYGLAANQFTYATLMALFGRANDVDVLEKLFALAGGSVPESSPFADLEAKADEHLAALAQRAAQESETHQLDLADAPESAAAATDAPPAAEPTKASVFNYAAAVDRLAAVSRPAALTSSSLPEYPAYVQLIRGLARAHSPIRALAVVHTFLANHPATSAASGASPMHAGRAATRHVLDAAVYTLARNGALGPAQSLVAAYEKKFGVEPTVRVQNYLLQNLVATHSTRRARKVARGMLAKEMHRRELDSAAGVIPADVGRRSAWTSGIELATLPSATAKALNGGKSLGPAEPPSAATPSRHRRRKTYLNFISMTTVMKGARYDTPAELPYWSKTARHLGLRQARVWRRHLIAA
ncbi:hypothetical protein H9P43_007720 [Blastocladiella emersonii ATCC 22665]|nr:hypothetical protein H9P43_007720 [Blastocladiella emersonii ATCC 22665]